MHRTDASITQMIDTYRQAVFDRDVDAFMRLYDPGVRVFDPWGVWSHEGSEAWRHSVDTWLSSLGEERVRVMAEEVQVWGERPMVAVSAFFGYAAFSGAGLVLRSMQNRLTWVLRAAGDAWRIVHEHTSLPVRLED